ncbi:SDR family NAD(P)-dependent oxidoreductase [Aegicerativicinus sediminis]|uniref:SDR family NAD(P)-dependent oxidoreductase n=1 Tax=Aegicerativicinus sediminis TaxID=2893202 RepID=UPI001E4D8B2A|nr:SDR family NAD(P)-dependent oxidoreductase [Aegicerativicinus sediminis]
MENPNNIKYPHALTEVINYSQLLGKTEIEIDQNFLQDTYSHKTILVSGAAGSIGQNIVQQLMEFHPKLIILVDNSESGIFEMVQELNSLNFKDFAVFLTDIRNQSRMQQLFERFHPEIVFHAAAYKHVTLMEENPYEAVSVNVLGTKIIVDLSIQFGVKKFVFISSDKAINPSSVMGATKRLGELYIQGMNDLDNTIFITTRFGNVIGSSGSVIPIFRRQIAKGGPITVTHKEATRYFLGPKESVQLVLEAAAYSQNSQIFLIEMGRPILILDLAKKILKTLNLSMDDIDIQIVGLRPGEKIHEELDYGKAIKFATNSGRLFTVQKATLNKDNLVFEIESFLNKIETFNHLEIVGEMKRLIPEYISINSKYDILDNQRKD